MTTLKPFSHNNYDMCKQLWESPQINWDGRLLGCCCNADIDFGSNVFRIGLEEALSSSSYCNAKNLLLNKIDSTSDAIPCKNCYYYKQMCLKKDFLTEEDFNE